ncbi:endonuclease/exonuclease/phosphatase family protein [Streptomyces zaomyceticus]|uniref:endonuclease/exonuclease/phosphatase family protein n=1 Tax=Streptomyces zaomyceticus TaxID=68286 RepID=UPI0033B211BA
MRTPLRAFLTTLFSVCLLLASGLTTARADEVTPANAPKPRFITYNVCGASKTCDSHNDKAKWLADVTGAIDHWEADVVMLQEVCYEQWKLLRTHLAGRSGTTYDAAWGAALPSIGNCARWDPDPNDSVAPDLRFGLAILAKGGPGTLDLTSRTVDFLPEPLEATGTATENRILLCAKSTVTGRTVRICNTHIDWHAGNKTAQIAKVAQITRGFAEAGEPIVLGGDFNQTPKHADMNPLYSHGAGSTGVFQEVDENDKDEFRGGDCPQTKDQCRSGENTASTACSPHTTENAKIDYIFLSSSWFTTVRGDAAACSGVADHHLLRGAAAWESQELPPASQEPSARDL